jgi:hypothetical protein
MYIHGCICFWTLCKWNHILCASMGFYHWMVLSWGWLKCIQLKVHWFCQLQTINVMVFDINKKPQVVSSQYHPNFPRGKRHSQITIRVSIVQWSCWKTLFFSILLTTPLPTGIPALLITAPWKNMSRETSLSESQAFNALCNWRGHAQHSTRFFSSLLCFSHAKWSDSIPAYGHQ